MEQKKDKINAGIKGVITIRHEVVHSDLEMRTNPGMFACLGITARYTSLMSATLRYQPHVTSESHGKITVNCYDRRRADDTPLVVHSFSTDKRVTFTISGFDCCLTEDCCPIVINVSPELEGLTYNSAVGELHIFPAFKSSNYPHPTTGPNVKELTSCVKGKRFQGMLVALDDIIKTGDQHE
uniref:Uncharacterized protein n=1 Tax=Maize yellow striate virus TaxID=1168550 RepID=A0A2D1GTQ2_9RHAB|nr:hypothetical protein [Maize yellow striate virus]